MTDGRLRAVAALVALAIIAAASLAWLRDATRDRIDVNASQRLLQRLSAVLPSPDQYDNEPQLDVLYLDDPLLTGPADRVPAYRARRAGEPVAIVLTVVAPDGYVDAIRLVVGIHRDGRITGVRALEHSETPGLGDGIDTARSDWVSQFTGRDSGETFALRRNGGDIDQLTGATITSRAVTRAVDRATRYYEQHRQRLLAPADDSVSGAADVESAP